MLASLDTIFTALGAAAAATSIISGIPIIRRSRALHKQSQHEGQIRLKEIFSDQDGQATEASEAAYNVKIQKVLILLSSIAGCGISTALLTRAVVGTQYDFIIGSILVAVSWLFLIGHSLYFFKERAFKLIFACSLHLLFVTLALSAVLGTEFVLFLLNPAVINNLDFGLFCGQLGASVLILLLSTTIPRRPKVYRDGRVVDGEKTASVISRITFAWPAPILKTANKTKHLEQSDLSCLSNDKSSFPLRDGFWKVPRQAKLCVHIIRAHLGDFIKQWSFQLVVSCLQFLPQVFMLKIIQSLENKKVVKDNRLWLYALGLFLSMTISSLVMNAMLYLGYGNLSIKIRSQLSALVFDKTTRKKDIKGTQKQDKTVMDDISEPIEPSEALKPAKKNGDADDDEEDALKGFKQGVVNLMAVDTTRISTFAAWNVIFVETVFTLIIGLFFLYKILGWQSMLAGVSVNIILLPFNSYVANIYTKAQDQVMKVRDKKMAVLSEALQGIRQIKFSALEGQWQKRIEDVREEELAQILRICVADTALLFFWVIGPIFLAVVSLSVHATINGRLVPSVAFTAISLFNELEFVMSVVPELIGDLLDAQVSSKRIQDYLDSPEKEDNIVHTEKIAFRNASVAWAADNNEKEQDRFVIRDMDIEFPRNELSVISGSTGSGKSLLLSALLGEADVLSGHIEMPKAPLPSERHDAKANIQNWILPSAVAYVAQIPWIENATIKENILFGLPYIESRYKRVLRACALTKDLAIMEDGDETEIGASGINLSGGQKWRLSFARALYSRAGILILDDIFSAVDAHVGRQIFIRGLTGDLTKGRTRILVTHHVHLCLSRAKYTVSLANGRVEHAGEVEVLRRSGSLAKIMAIDDQEKDDDLLTVETIAEGDGTTAIPTPENGVAIDKRKAKTFVQEEFREQGAVKKDIYRRFLNSSGGYPFWITCAFFFGVAQSGSLARTWWLKLWSGSYDTESIGNYQPTNSFLVQTVQHISPQSEEKSLKYWILMYLAISSAVVVIGTFKYAVLFFGCLRSSRIVFKDMTYTILRTPLRWLDTVPVGRILNRFSADFAKFDIVLGNHVAFFFLNFLALVGVVVAGIVVSPYVIAFSAVLLAFSYYYAIYYLNAARELKRMESNKKSPILELYGSVIVGVATIRAFGKAEEYIEKMFSQIDAYAELSYFLWLSNRWMSIRLAFVGTFFSTIIALVVISTPGIDAALAGFALTFALEYTSNCIWCLRRYADLELDMNSAERIIEYTLLPTEDQSGVTPPASWPSEGKVKFDNLVVSYDTGLPPVLKGLSFETKARERVGVVGRTGAGKSSVTLALFRFLNASEGAIYIDDLDISKVPLYDLRSRLTIIPQDPVLFSGTIRSNLDAFNQHSDSELRDALERVHLVKTSRDEMNEESTSSATSTLAPANNSNIFNSLDSSIAEGGSNLSAGQKQLTALARAILSRPKIMILDEATSAVDMELDALIQRSVREEFASTTLLVIAHRLQTIIDYDRILVLDDGRVLEYDTPWNLIQKRGAFWEMIMQTGDSDALIEAAKTAAGV